MPGVASPAQPVSAPASSRAAPRTPGDPLESVNRRFYRTQSGIDRGFFGPIARFYKRTVPRVIRSGLRNIIRNLTEPIVFVNDVLQLKPKRAVRTLGRFAVNSTIGVGGVIDVAKAADLPHRPNGFGNTLGRYGVGPGPFLYLPLIGPTTLRDLFGGQADGLVLPVAVGFPFDRLDYQLSRGIVSTLDRRAEAEDDLKALLAGAVDPYATLRSVYLQSRAATIAELQGKNTDEDVLDDPLLDPQSDPVTDASSPDLAPPEPSTPEAVDPKASETVAEEPANTASSPGLRAAGGLIIGATPQAPSIVADAPPCHPGNQSILVDPSITLPSQACAIIVD